ncbi:uncharacterized protein LOC135691494 [Rhopilema esculentum]|uniref:uncharacterized protein LOC135691494 n=1 Tax=Rhopilema esculentum TaxID=499914 RepID=UPI0031DA4CBC
MGHSAKYGAYTIFCTNLKKIVDFELVQKCIDSEVLVSQFVSDRHRGVAKWLREEHPAIKHYFDIWHIARTLTKKLIKAGNENNCQIINKWTATIRNHLYWCATSSKQGFGQLIIAKWKSIINHIQDIYTHEDPLFNTCIHQTFDRKRKWIKNGTTAFDKLKPILLDTRLLNDIKSISSDAQTSCLEAFHATLNHWHPKMINYHWLGTKCRHILAICHFNENLSRETMKTDDGQDILGVSFPKYKLGEEVVKPVPVAPIYAQQQKTMMEQEAKKARGTEKKKTSKTGHCRTCGETMLGHSKQKCVSK